ncbi:hypothetical protein ACFQI7_05790 [Paenibacillus allorhizosphaerae]|uniref:SLH domain-containing protein n=1 Tax=Paenibacillus allorhizosphaerae TaxID=2849866 RepID=A0ABM8VBJ5_9BACL|nr:hypothetical protein [Paenibacillus allorhizosphaerae]CAG7620449.1 hypothetical protein PAECIP111802_00668 [Paenibacillus allorhizosphaerae]
MKRKWTVLLMIWLCFVSAFPRSTVWAETTEANRDILQKGLTVYEIDRELGRISERQATLTAQLKDTEQKLQAARSASAEARQHAAKVIRAYYQGDRDSLWTIVFSIRSLSDALSVLEYLQMILHTDRQALSRHETAWKQLTALQAEQTQAQTALTQTKDRYTNERARLVTLQKEVDEMLAKNKEAVKVQQQITDLNRLWQDKGVPLFKTYFQALAKAMNDLPEIMTAGSPGSGGKTSNLIMNGFNYTFQMTDQELNAFLQKKNEIFRNMTFRFTEDAVIASGKQDDIALTIKGRYEMASKDNGKSKSFIRYSIQELLFNGYALPATTVEELQKNFDLGIYPQNIASFLQITGLKLEEGKLSIFIKLAL